MGSSLIIIFLFTFIFVLFVAALQIELRDRAMLREMRKRIAQTVIAATIRAEKLKHDWR